MAKNLCSKIRQKLKVPKEDKNMFTESNFIEKIYLRKLKYQKVFLWESNICM